MTAFLFRWIINTLALLIVIWIVPGIYVASWEPIIVAALLLGLFNAFLRPVIIFLTLPLQIATLGLSIFIVNGFMFYLVAQIVKGFTVAGFWSAFWGALLFSIISFILNLVIIDRRGRVHVDFKEYRSVHRGRVPPGDVIDVEGKVEDDK